jgi:hypothetical protein
MQMPLLNRLWRGFSSHRSTGFGQALTLRAGLATAAAAGLVFQVWHVVEPAMPTRQAMPGVELLYLVASGIFLTALACLYFCVLGRWIRTALYLQSFHLGEHFLLIASGSGFGKPLGLSTLFGYADEIGGLPFAVGYRVAWHIAMNLLPMVLAVIGLADYWRHHAGSVGGNNAAAETTQ